MDLDHPEINTSELTAEVRKSMERHVLKSHGRSPNSAASENSSPAATTLLPEEDNSTRVPPVSTGLQSSSLNPAPGSLPKSPQRESQGVFQPNTDDAYRLNDLLKLHDANFLDAAYRAVLKRKPDSLGYNYYLAQLREGHLDRVDVISILRNSSEGRSKNVQIEGLGLPTFVRRLSHLPVIGYPIRLGIDLLRLPVLLHRIRQQKAFLMAEDRKAAEHGNQIAEHVDSVNEAISKYLTNLAAAVTDLSQRSTVYGEHQAETKRQLETLAAQGDNLVAQQASLLTSQETLAAQQEQIVVQLRQDIRVQIENERRGARELARRLVQQQQSLFESLLESSNKQRAADIAGLESSTRAWIADLESSARAWTVELESAIREKLAGIESANIDLNTKIAAAESSDTELRAKIAETESTAGDLTTRIDSVESAANDIRVNTEKLQSFANTAQAEIEKVYRQLQQARTELAIQGTRMAVVLEEARSRLPGAFQKEQLEIIAAEEQHKLDALYAELEDNFRGSQDEIKERFRTYLPHINLLPTAADMLIVDLGCGRGEWLELLKEEGYQALGVDTNTVLLDRCRARDLDVIEIDALGYLRGRPDNSLSAITGFHIIEHLSIEILMNLLDEIIRVLRPGGIVIFETPNPENVLVGSNFFYFDPTHRNPLPSLLMKFLLESRGLGRIEVINLHAWDQARILGTNELTARFNELFYGPMDYAITGWKVSE